MKQKVISLFLGGMVIGLGFYLVPAAQAEGLEDLPDRDQLTTEITTTATAEVNAELAGELEGQTNQPAPNTTQPSPTPAPQPSDALIINTGDDTNVDSSANTSSDTEVNNQNEANLEQQIEAYANTGDNEASRNISFGGNSGTINTGNAAVYSQIIADANNSTTGISGNCPASTGSNGSVINTGDNLGYDAGNNHNCSTTVSNGNGAVINQSVNAEANTGDNIADRNIAIGGGSAGAITTGDASVGSLVVAQANHNLVIVGGQSNNGSPGSGASIYLVNTGDNANVDSSTSTYTDIEVNNENYAEIDQSLSVIANTGGNHSDRNINTNGDAGVIETGDATVITEVSTSANSNQTGIGTGNQAGTGSSNTQVVNTGDNLDVDAGQNSDTDIEVNNDNYADVDQDATIVANTGHNTANRNIAFNGDAGSITTGDATVITSLETNVNQNATVISGSDFGDVSDGSAEGSTEIINTGDNLTADVSDHATTDIEANNTNEATVNQSIDVKANTGDNTADRNIGQTSMTTGNVTVTTEIITNANNNYTFIVDSGATGLDIFQQFVEAFLGIGWMNLVGDGYSDDHNNNVSLVNTGDNAQVLAENTTTKQVQVNNTNTAKVDQHVDVNANTGGNSCSGNVGGCDISTGEAIIWTQLIANLNNNFTFIGNVQLPTPDEPEQPEQPEEPTQPEEPQAPEEEEDEDNGLVLGEDIERPTAVLAAQLPMTGGVNLALLGGVLAIAGAALAAKQRQAQV